MQQQNSEYMWYHSFISDIADLLPHPFTNFWHEQTNENQDRSDIESDLDVLGPSVIT